MFDLYFEQSNVASGGATTCVGGIAVGEFSGRFVSCTEFWKKSDYEESWKNSLQLLFDTNFCVFFTDINDPKISSHFFGYQSFLLDTTVYVQEKIFFQNQYDLDEIQHLKFSKKEPLILINEDGNKVSTWTCPVESILQYYKNSYID